MSSNSTSGIGSSIGPNENLFLSALSPLSESSRSASSNSTTTSSSTSTSDKVKLCVTWQGPTYAEIPVFSHRSGSREEYHSDETTPLSVQTIHFRFTGAKTQSN